MGLNKRKYTIGIRSKLMQITYNKLRKRKQLFLTGKNSFDSQNLVLLKVHSHKFKNHLSSQYCLTFYYKNTT